jgi:CheY-like chemotaxis protein
MENEHLIEVANRAALLTALSAKKRLAFPGLDDGIQQSSPLVGRVLLVEDDFFLAFDLHEELSLCGMEVLGPVGHLDEAFSLARSDQRIDAAVIDINLHGEFAFHLVDELVRRDIPVVFTTGYDGDVVPYRLRHIPRYLKPIPACEVAGGVVELVAHQ